MIIKTDPKSDVPKGLIDLKKVAVIHCQDRPQLLWEPTGKKISPKVYSVYYCFAHQGELEEAFKTKKDRDARFEEVSRLFARQDYQTLLSELQFKDRE